METFSLSKILNNNYSTLFVKALSCTKQVQQIKKLSINSAELRRFHHSIYWQVPCPKAQIKAWYVALVANSQCKTCQIKQINGELEFMYPAPHNRIKAWYVVVVDHSLFITLYAAKLSRALISFWGIL